MSARTRVVHLVERLGRGGLERVVETLAVELDPARYEPRVLTLREGGPVADALRARGVRVEPAACEPVLRPSAVAALAAQLRAMEAGVVHGHGWLPGALARLAGARAGAASRIAHRHTTDEGERWRHRRLELVLSKLGRTVCCSQAVRERAIRSGGCDPLRTEVVYNGVSLERFSPRPPGLSGGPPVLITVASLRALKGHRVLLEAAARLAARGVPFRLELVGDGPERNDLESFVRARALSERVAFLGERDDVPALLRCADLFVLPTTGREGLGLAALEAMAAGLPVVASRLEGLEEVVDHGRTGYLVTPGEPQALERAVLELLRDPEHAASLGREGRERVERHFGAATMTRFIEALYRRDLGGEPAAPRTVLFLSSRGTSYGGGQAGLEMLAGALGPPDYGPFVVVPESGGLAAKLSAVGVPNLMIPMPPVRSMRIDRVLRAGLRLRRLARRLRPCIVHVDGTRAALYALGLPRSIRRVWHLRDVRPDRLDPWLAPAFDRLVAVCRAAAVNRFPDLPPDLVRVVPNAVPPRGRAASRARVRRRLGVGDDDLVLLAVGRVEPQKGVEELVRAVAALERMGIGVRAVVAGQRDPGTAERLEALARQSGVAWRVKLLGRRHDVPDLMAAADLLVHPSHYEAAPRVVLEAMEAGLPVVATRVGGIPEILEGCGELVPDRDPEALAGAVARLLRDPESAVRLSAAARRRYWRRYTPERHVRAIVAVYDELLGLGPAHRREAA